MQLTLIYTESKVLLSKVLLSKKQYASWREVQGDYPDYKTSLGPWSVEEVIEFLTEEYSNFNPSAQEQVNNFVEGSAVVKSLVQG